MSGELNGKTIAVLATDGVEQVELDQPWQALVDAGAQPRLIGVEPGHRGVGGGHPPRVTVPARGRSAADVHIGEGEEKTVGLAVADAGPEAFDALVLPGGVINGDFVRADASAVAFVRAFFDAGKPVAAICHAPWVLAEADVVRGRRMTSWPSLQTDLRNAGADWVDEEVVVRSEE